MTEMPVMQTHRVYEAFLSGETDREGWREAARKACAAGISPEMLRWQVAGRPKTLDLNDYQPLPDMSQSQAQRIAAPLLKEIMTALLHSDEGRFELAYRLVWRAQSEPKIHLNPADADVKKICALAKSVRRDIHKMHAFVRFRKIGEQQGREQFVAWFEPDHHITAAVAPFFRNRFAGMDWLIVTPECSICWDGKALDYGPGGDKKDVAQEDCIEEEWRSYYANIFNPARVKVQAMKSEMPMKYWRNLPEADLIPSLIEQAGNRTADMIEKSANQSLEQGMSGWSKECPVTDDRQTPSSLSQLYDLLEQRQDAPVENFSEKLVHGEGPDQSELMFVGEQPGDQEDRDGRVFTGPAGEMLNRAMVEAGIERQDAFLTNAVKRFKFIRRGKRRIHQTPNAAEIDYYRWWVDQECQLVKPKILVALGGSAAYSLLGKKITLSRYRGRLFDMGENRQLFITVHPSYLLRIPDPAGQEIEYQKFVRDLALVKAAI